MAQGHDASARKGAAKATATVLKKLFGRFSKARVPAVETCRTPEHFKSIEAPEKNWITSQVFVDCQDSSARFYYAAEYNDHSRNWCILRYQWNVRDEALPEGSMDSSGSYYAVERDVENIIIKLIALEKEAAAPESGFVPIKDLKGNYRQAANFHGGHIDNDGRYVRIDRQKPAAMTATFTRKALEVLYAPDQRQPEIASWDDFYREVVERVPYPVQSTEEARRMSGYKMKDKYCQALEEMAGIVIDLRRRQPPKELSLLLLRFSQESDACARYNGHVLVLAKLLREGAHIFQGVAASSAGGISGEDLSTLSEIATSVKMICCARLSLTEKQAQQIAALITQGSDPHAEKPLPFEKQYRELLARSKYDGGFYSP